MSIINEYLSLEDVKNAYRKVKSIAYFDKTYSNLKKRIIEFEFLNQNNGISIEDKINELYINVNKRLENGDSKVSLSIKTKSIHTNEKVEDNEIDLIYNNNENDLYLYSTDDLQAFIILDLEDYIISMAWTMSVGSEIDKSFDKNVYGNRIKTSHINNNSLMKKSPYLMMPYFEQYQSWQNNAFDIAKTHFEQKEDLIFINMDLKRFYYNVDFQGTYFDEIISLTKGSKLFGNDKTVDKLTFHIYDIMDKYSKKLTSLDMIVKDKIVLPIAFFPSSVLSNYYLKEYDDFVLKSKPVYYGRYVDDMIIIYKNNKEFETTNKINKIEILKKYLTVCDNKYESSIKIDKRDIQLDLLHNIKSLNLRFNGTKSKIFFFDHKGVTKNIDSFKTHINRNSSEFRLIPDLNDAFGIDKIFNTNSLDKHKLSTSLDNNLSKYEFSKYIAKLAQVLKSTSYIEDKIFVNLFEVLTKKNLIDVLLNWEQIFTAFILGSKYKLLDDLINRIKSASNSIILHESLNEGILMNIKKTLMDELYILLSRTFALVSEETIDLFNSLTNEDKENIKIYRTQFLISGMVNKNYIGINTLFLKRGLDFKKSYLGLEAKIDDLIEIDKFKKTITKNNNLYFIYPYNVSLLDIKMNLLYYQIKHCELPFHGENTNHTIDIKSFWNVINGYNKTSRNDNSNIKESRNDNKIIVTYKESYDKSNKSNWKSDLSKPTIAVGNVTNHFEEKKYYDYIRINKKDVSLERYRNFSDSANTVLKFRGQNLEKVDLFILPEVYLPLEWVSDLSIISKKNDMAVISGVEHIKYKDNYYNFVVSVFPVHVGEFTLVDVNFHLKVHYSPDELLEFDSGVISGYTYEMFKWRGINITPYCCYELTSVEDRILFKKEEVNVIATIVYNKDLQYFSNIVESLSRDLNCFVLQVNDAKYGDSRIFQPSRGYNKDILKMRGGINYTALISTIELNSLKMHLKRPLHVQKSDKNWKTKYPQVK